MADFERIGNGWFAQSKTDFVCIKRIKAQYHLISAIRGKIMCFNRLERAIEYANDEFDW